MIGHATQPIEHRYDDAGALAAALAALLRGTATDAIAARGRAVFALAGGRTPLPAYRAWAHAMSAHAPDAAGRRVRENNASAETRPRSPTTDGPLAPRLVLLPTDERCVPHEHPACNARELRGIFTAATGVHIESLTTPDGDPDTSARFAQDALDLYRDPFDLVVLGMGMDAHTASLFPGAPQLAAALDASTPLAACRIDPHPLPAEAPFARISLTAARLRHARALHLVVTGAAKRAVLDSALAPGADPLRAPVAAIAHAPLHVHWSP